jgi:hypothetical protein
MINSNSLPYQANAKASSSDSKKSAAGFHPANYGAQMYQK